MADGSRGAKRRTALITGASSGIGDRLARRFAAGGFDLALVARREDRLRALADELARAHGVEAQAIAADLADPEAPRAVVARLSEAGREVDALVNNAGFARQGPFAEIPERVDLEMVRVNVEALVLLTKLLLPGMVARRRGWVLNVASTAAFVPGPLMATYYASKAFVLSFSEALASEVAESGVTVTALCPGPVATEFAGVAGAVETPLFRSGRVLSADAVANAGYDALMAGRRVVIPGLSNRILVGSTRFAPRRLLAAIARRLNSPPGGSNTPS
jgi:short-subunit dehydrogenase